MQTLGKECQVPIPHFKNTTTANKHAPVTKAMVHAVKEPGQDVVEKTFITRAVYRRRVTKEPVDAVELMQNLMARLIQ